MDKKAFKRIEGRIYNYYKNLDTINKIEAEIKELEYQLISIKEDIRSTNVTIDADIQAVAIEERVQTSNTSNAIEKALEREIDKLEKEYIYVRNKLMKKKLKLRELRRNISSMQYNINMLKAEDKRLIELKYKEKKSVVNICFALNTSKSSLFKRKDELVENIGHWIGILK